MDMSSSIDRHSKYSFSLLIIISSILCTTCDYNELKEFSDHFYDHQHILNYANCIDSLRVLGLNQVFRPSGDTLLIKRDNTVTTSNGIILEYNIIVLEDTTVHSLVLSRPPYLATPFARNLVSLFAMRTGLPIPDSISVAQEPVYFAEWYFPNEEDSISSDYDIDSQYPTVDSLFLDAFIASRRIGIKHIYIPTD